MCDVSAGKKNTFRISRCLIHAMEHLQIHLTRLSPLSRSRSQPASASSSSRQMTGSHSLKSMGAQLAQHRWNVTSVERSMLQHRQCTRSPSGFAFGVLGPDLKRNGTSRSPGLICAGTPHWGAFHALGTSGVYFAGGVVQ